MGKTNTKNRGVDPARLTDKQRRFVAAYIKSGNAAKACIEAGYSAKTAAKQGAVLLKMPLVEIAVGKGTKTILDEEKIDATIILKELFNLLTRDVGEMLDSNGSVKSIADMSPRERSAIDGFEIEEYTDEDGIGRVKTKIRLSPKATAVDMALKHKGLYAAIIEKHKISIDWDEMARPTDHENEPDVIENRLLEME